MRINKYLPIIIIIITIIISLGKQLSAGVIDRVVAVVNDDVITQIELDDLIVPIYEQYKDIYTGDEFTAKLEKAYRNMLDQLIEEKLILQEAKRLEIKVDEAEVEQRLTEVKERFPSEDVFEDAIASQNLTVNKLKGKYREQLMVQRLIDKEIGRKVAVPPFEINQYYDEHKEDFVVPEQVNVRTILINLENRTEEAAKERTADILAQLKKGEDFVALVEKYSDDTTVTLGGDMGYIQRGTMMKEIDEVLFSLNIGEISQAVKTKLGFYIFKIEDKKEKQYRSFQEIQPQISQKLYREKAAKHYKQWVEKLKEDAYIQIR
ncbi:MAG: peptidylprolyl isomerase [Candidatus Omnitrophota bacterium]